MKSHLLAQFDMKDLQATKYILEIMRDRENKYIWLSHCKYVNSMLQFFHMVDCIPFSVLIYVETNILVFQHPTTPTQMDDIVYIAYAIALGIFLCTLQFVLDQALPKQWEF